MLPVSPLIYWTEKDIPVRNAAIVLVTHYNKGLSSQSLNRVSGSNAIAASSRVIWSLSNDKETNIRTVACSKNNISQDRSGFTFNIVDARISILDEYVDITADEMLVSRMNGGQKRGRPPRQTEAAEAWLIDFLKDAPKSAEEIKYASEQVGFSWQTIDRISRSINFFKKKKPKKNGCGLLIQEHQNYQERQNSRG